MLYVGVNGRDHRDAMIKCVSAIRPNGGLWSPRGVWRFRIRGRHF